MLILVTTVIQFGVQAGIMRSIAILLGLVLAMSLFGQPEPKMAKKKKNEDKEPVTQSLPLLPVPPLVISAETGRLTFQLSPLSSKGLLSQQSRDALKALMQKQSRRGNCFASVPLWPEQAICGGSSRLLARRSRRRSCLCRC